MRKFAKTCYTETLCVNYKSAIIFRFEIDLWHIEHIFFLIHILINGKLSTEPAFLKVMSYTGLS